MQHPRLMIVLVLCAVFSLAACGGEEEASSPSDTPAAANEPSADEPAAADQGGGGGGGGSVCERARSCCTAYVDAVAANTPGVSAATACAGVQNATGPGADVGCQAAIDGWRQSLTAMGTAVPSACQ